MKGPFIMRAKDELAVPRGGDRLTGESLHNAQPIIDLGVLPVPGLFFSTADAAAAAVVRVRLLKSVTTELIQLDSDIDPQVYANYKSGAATPAHLAFVESLADVFSRRYPRDARILEIGGGAGHFMRSLSKRGFRNLYVIDPSPENRNNKDFTAIQGSFPEAITETGLSFDVVVGQHFLEHCSNPVAVLRAVREILSPQGQVWIEVPDIDESATADGGVWLSIVYALHSSYFGSETLKLACAYAGLTVSDIQSVSHYGKSLLAVCSPGVTCVPTSRALNMDQTLVVAAIQRYFAALKQFGAAVPPGTTCWGAAERCIAVLGGCMRGGFDPGAIIDSNEDLRGLYVSGMKTSVVSPQEIAGPLPSVLILSPQNASAIMAANQRLFSSSTKVYIPVVQ
jgi:SAM-dependent methyltransferase